MRLRPSWRGQPPASAQDAPAPNQPPQPLRPPCAVACVSRLLRPIAEADCNWGRLFAQRFPRLLEVLPQARPLWWAGASWRQRFAALCSGAPFQAQVYNREQGAAGRGVAGRAGQGGAASGLRRAGRLAAARSPCCAHPSRRPRTCCVRAALRGHLSPPPTRRQ